MRLLPWQADDWLLLRPIGRDPQVMRYISDGEPWPDERIREFVGRQVAHFDRLGYCLWKLLLKETSERIGAIAQPINRASIHVMEKLGMKYEREMIHRGFDVVLYAADRSGDAEA